MEIEESVEQSFTDASEEAPADQRPKVAGMTGVTGVTEDDGDVLTERQREMLDFERTWWQFDEPRDEVIEQRFGCTADEYYAELNRVLELPGAMLHDPLVVRRFHRRRLRRRRSLIDGGSASNRESQGSQGGAHA
jgi:hypothetical protein